MIIFYFLIFLIPIILLLVYIFTKNSNSKNTPNTPNTPNTQKTIPIPPDNSVDICGRCTNSSQCKISTDPSNPIFCCPYMKLCVNEQQACPSDFIADCNPRCFDQYDQTKCNCKNPDFPYNWIDGKKII